MSNATTRRSFFASGAAIPFALRSLSAHAQPSPRWAVLGTDKGEGIYRCSWDSVTGKLGAPRLAVRAERPDFLALHPHLPRLYAVNAVGDGKGGVSSFHADRATGALTFSERQSSHGDGPCFISVDATGRCAFVANYSGGSLAALLLAADGALLPAAGSLDCNANPACGVNGPVHERQDASHMHCATLSPGNDFLVACDLGNDSIDVLTVRPGAERPLGTAFRFAARPGSGPRHAVFHPNGQWLYVLHEIDCTLQCFEWSVQRGRPLLRAKPDTVISTLAAGRRPQSDTASELTLSRDGRFVYAATRLANEIAVYGVDRRVGALTEIQRISCGGQTPRHITLDPSERWLLCANQAAPGCVTTFARGAGNGHLTGPVQTLAADTPMFVQFL